MGLLLDVFFYAFDSDASDGCSLGFGLGDGWLEFGVLFRSVAYVFAWAA
jgi:hypothetical protein